MSRDGRKTGGGSRKGRPNRATKDVREAIARVLEGNADNLGSWLTSVAEGVKEPEYDLEGQPVLDEKGEPKFEWLRRPDPGLAVKLALDMAEYHIPKLARTDMNVGGQLTLQARLIIKPPNV